MKTHSETLFENLCAAQKLECKQIKEGANKTPDYLVYIGNLVFVVEVKQANPNNEQNRVIAEFGKRSIKRSIGFRMTNGEKVRSAIKSGAPQISKLARGKMPGMLVLYNNFHLFPDDPFPLDPYNIRVGMFGFDTIVLKPRYFSPPMVLDRKFGPKRKLTKEHNTSISALAVMNKTEPNRLDVYHNPHAAIPFERGIFRKFGNKEYELEEKIPMRFQEWKEVDS